MWTVPVLSRTQAVGPLRNAARARCTFDPSRAELAGTCIIVSTGEKPTEAMLCEAEDVAARLGAPLVPRGRISVTRLLQQQGAEIGYFVTRTTLGGGADVRHELRRLGDPHMRLFTNPRMWSKVKTSTGFGAAPLARAISREDEPPPLRIVDGTAGLGGTAIRISETFGPSCEVTAVEASAPLAVLLEYGLQRLASQPTAWAAAAGRVRAVHADAAEYLERLAGDQPARRPCVVYLNPCMDLARPSEEDRFLHKVARLSPISELCLATARRVATRRVVMRAPNGADPMAVGYGETPDRVVKGKQSSYFVYEQRR